MALIGALFLTVIAGIALMYFVGLPFLGFAFGGPTKENCITAAIFLPLAVGDVLLWWHFVGTNIHFSFG